MKKIKIKLSYSSFRILLDLVGHYIKHHNNLEKLILIHLKPKLWKKAMDEKEVSLNLEPFQADVIKHVLLYESNHIALAEKNELRMIRYYLDEALTNLTT